MKRPLLIMIAVGFASLVHAADQSVGAPTKAPSKQTASANALQALPLGDVAGGARNSAVVTPPASSPAAVKAGEALFRAMNCAYCHGLKAKGVMGPDLTDGYWRYGGTPAKIFKSIMEGRPEGMPSWGKMLPPESIWQIVAYIESLGGTYPSGDEEAAMDGDLAKGNTKPGAGVLPVTQGSY